MSDSEAVASSQDVSLVRELADVLADTGLTEIEMKRGDLVIRVVRQAPAAAPQIFAAPAAAAPPPAATAAAGPAPLPAQTAAGEVVKSPMVGTVYLQAQPGAAPFVREGDPVAEGQTLLLIEAMKTMNPIVAPRGGVLLQLLIADSQPVEYGEPLAVIG